MKGVILAAGEGTRMWPTTKLYAKSMVQVYDRPMIDYPLRTLKAMGCEDVVIVSSPRGLGLIAQHVGDGAQMEMDVTYRIQPEGTTIAEPIRKLKIEGVFPLILGDCYYSPALPRRDRATLFFKHYPFANQHSVWSPEADAIVEKPRVMSLGDRAIIGYYYDDRVYDFVEEFESDGRRLDIVDIHNFYRANHVPIEEYEGFFADMGTADGLLRAANYEQERQQLD